MINNNTIRNCVVPFPAIQGLVNEHTLGKIYIKNLYQSWKGESIATIRDRHETNPYTLRIGKPSTDNQLKNDSLFFVQHYLSYNPVTRDIEKRALVPYRNMEKVYIGQSLDEGLYNNYKLFVDGTTITDDIYLKKYEALREAPLGRVITNLIDRVEKMQLEIADLKRQLQSSNIYTQDTL